jgi:hypothetical protein
MSKNKELSFLPEDYVERRIEQRTNLLCLTLFGVVLIGVVAAYVATSKHRSDLRQQRAEVNAQYAEAARNIERLEELQRRKEQMLRKAQITSQLVEPVPRTFLLADLINRMPPTLSLFELQMDAKLDKPALPQAATRGKTAMANAKVDGKGDAKKAAVPEPLPRYIVTMKLIGVAPTDVQVAQYMASLSQSELLSDVNLVFSEESKVEETTMRRFHIDMTLNAEADARKVEPLLADRQLKMNPLDDAGESSKAVILTPAGPETGGAAAGEIKRVSNATNGRED